MKNMLHTTSAYFKLYIKKMAFNIHFIWLGQHQLRGKKGEPESLKKREEQIHLHIFRLNGPSESAHGDGSRAMRVRVTV